MQEGIAEQLVAARSDLAELFSQNSELEERVNTLELQKHAAEEQLAQCQQNAVDIAEKLSAKQEEFMTMNKEHEDMLILLAQQVSLRCGAHV